MLELNKLYNMDCMDGMKQFPDKYFDLAIVDPPYGIGENGDKAKSRGKRIGFLQSKSNAKCYAKSYESFAGDDINPPEKEYFDELMRVSKNQIIWGANHFISRIPIDSHCWIVWDKRNGDTDFADCELAWTSFKTAVRIFRFKWNGMLQEDMKNKEIRIHPTQKPVALYKWLLGKYAQQGDKILDTHAGSASSLVACYDEGFEFVGFELSEHYYKLANDRLQDQMQQLKLL